GPINPIDRHHTPDIERQDIPREGVTGVEREDASIDVERVDAFVDVGGVGVVEQSRDVDAVGVGWVVATEHTRRHTRVAEVAGTDDGDASMGTEAPDIADEAKVGVASTDEDDMHVQEWAVSGRGGAFGIYSLGRFEHQTRESVR